MRTGANRSNIKAAGAKSEVKRVQNMLSEKGGPESKNANVLLCDNDTYFLC